MLRMPRELRMHVLTVFDRLQRIFPLPSAMDKVQHLEHLEIQAVDDGGFFEILLHTAVTMVVKLDRGFQAGIDPLVEVHVR